MNQQKGFIQLIILAAILIAIGIAVYLIFRPEIPKNLKTSPNPSPSMSSYQKQKLESYDKYKEDIKSRLNLSEEEFQALKRFSAED